ncbi:aminoglycoside phosphotransferase family protein [Streptomyces sp. NBC_01433]|uniref:phosphotransferase n=1 Tax=Streptomyces sp. NBC_01433 TaxID=2903864 RepID=UPI002253C6FD|nr:aminoglycoside phosphotransferase family protein [Streptomyces sp. NBC_01433]MCX4676267.1 aminoglycoside phosphotransferase family protein [Streptomyces sp. NBC_01433]
MHTGQLLGSGRTADVYALDGSWVLRRYRDSTDTTPELAVMSYLCAFGFPVPRIGPPADGARATDLVLQRLTGPTMAEALLTGALEAAEGGALLAGLLRELHAIPARLSPDPEERILHLDLHPENVMLTDRGPVVIDWSNTVEGPPGLDRAMSALILAQVALDPAFPAAGKGTTTATVEAEGTEEAEGAATGTSGTPAAPAAGVPDVRSLLTALLTELAADGGVSVADLARARTRRAADPRLTEPEAAALDEAVALVRSHAP